MTVIGSKAPEQITKGEILGVVCLALFLLVRKESTCGKGGRGVMIGTSVGVTGRDKNKAGAATPALLDEQEGTCRLSLSTEYRSPPGLSIPFLQARTASGGE